MKISNIILLQVAVELNGPYDPDRVKKWVEETLDEAADESTDPPIEWINAQLMETAQ